jgi:hypothetical protein
MLPLRDNVPNADDNDNMIIILINGDNSGVAALAFPEFVQIWKSL